MKTIELSGVVGYDITAKGLKNRLPKDGSDALLKIDSVGGSVYEGNRLYNVINDYPGLIKVQLGAIAASAASYFPMAAGIENISVRENTTFMGHKAWALAIGNADDMKQEAEILDGFDKIIAKAYSKATGKDIDSILEDMKNEFWLIGGQSVVDAGFASSIISDEDSKDDDKPMEKAEILAKIEEARLTLRLEAENEDLSKWAARIKEEVNSTDVDSEGQQLLFSEPAPSGAKNIKEEDMDLDAYLNTPEGKADFEKRTKAANEEAVKAALEVERKNVAQILNYAGLALNENVQKAIENGTDPRDYAAGELTRVRENRKDGKDGGQDMGGLDVKGQLPKKAEAVTEDSKEKAAADSVEAYLKAQKGGK